MRELNIEKQDLTEMDQLLIDNAIKGIPWRYKEFPEDKIQLLEYELNIIINMGFSDYFLIVQDFLDVGRRIGYMPDDRILYLKEHVYEMTIPEMIDYINEDQSHPGMTIGPGRGSAVGSIVAYLLGITSVEPTSNGLLFERFLNPERVSMPDIDSDLSKSEFEYGVRDIVIEYVAKKYGRNAICSITTPSTLAAKAAVKNVARIAGAKRIQEMIDAGHSVSKDEEAKIKKLYLNYADRINAMVPSDPNAAFAMKMSDSENAPTLSAVLHESFQNEPDVLEIIDIAERAEGLNVNFGMHACGKIIYPGDIRDNSALMKDPKTGIWKLQMDAEEAEESGLLKMDFLGLKNLNLITKAARLIEKNYGIKLDLYNLPEDPEVYKHVFSQGFTYSVFQFESPGMRKMLKKFGPTMFSDLVLLVACYRPGPMQYLPDIIKRKHGRTDVADTAILHIPQIKEIVDVTYMSIVYQGATRS